MLDFKTLDKLSSGVVFIDVNKKIKFINASARKFINKDVGEPCFGSFEICESCPVDNSKEEIETVNTKLSCCKKTVCLSVKPIYENGRLIGFLEEIRDSTKIATYIEQIEAEKEFNKIVLESVIDAILVVDEEGQIIQYNQVAKDIICKEAEDIRGMRY